MKDLKVHSTPSVFRRLCNRLSSPFSTHGRPRLTCGIVLLSATVLLVFLVSRWIGLLEGPQGGTLWEYFSVRGIRSPERLARFCLFEDPESCSQERLRDILTKAGVESRAIEPIDPPAPPWTRHDLWWKLAESTAAFPDSDLGDIDRLCRDLVVFASSSVPIERSYSFAKIVFGQDRSIQQLMEWDWNDAQVTRTEDLERLCQMKFSVRRGRQQLLTASAESLGLGQPARPILVDARKVVKTFWPKLHNQHFAFDGCSVTARLFSEQDEKNGVVPDILLQGPYCQEGWRMTRKDKNQAIGHISMEVAFPTHEDARIRNSRMQCMTDVDYFVGFHRFADVPVGYDDLSVFQGIHEFRAFFSKMGKGSKEELREETRAKRSGTQFAASFISECSLDHRKPHFYRTRYVEILERFISLDSYGKCGQNLKKESSLWKSERDPAMFQIRRKVSKCQTANKYRFVLAFENSMRDSYVTEKLWDALMCGSTLPVYFGAPNVLDSFPPQMRKYKMFVNANEFPDPRDLATYLHYLDKNLTAYEEFFQWRFDGVRFESTQFPSVGVEKTVDGENVSFFCRMVELYAGKQVYRPGPFQKVRILQ